MPLDREGPQMLLRRKIALAACASAITAPLLSSCGFDNATDQVYTPGAGTNNRDYAVDVLAATVVAAQPGSGTFVAGLSNNFGEAITLTGLTGADVTVELEPVEVPPEGFVNLASEDLHVTGTVEAGDVLAMTAEFDNGDQVDLEVPVVTSCDEYEGYDTSTGGGGEPYSCEFPDSEAH